MNISIYSVFHICLELFSVKHCLKFMFKGIHSPFLIKIINERVMKIWTPPCYTKCEPRKYECISSKIFVNLWIINLGVHSQCCLPSMHFWWNVTCSWIGGMPIARPWVERKRMFYECKCPNLQCHNHARLNIPSTKKIIGIGVDGTIVSFIL